MALPATLHRIDVALSDVDRGIYEQLDLHVARHPSETLRFLVTRTLGYCLHYQPGIAFSKGLSTTDEPAVWVREPDGRVRLWLEVGRPSAERLHKASKLAERVVVVCAQGGIEALRRSVEGERVHRARSITVVALPAEVVDGLSERMTRHAAWEVLRTEGHLYVTSGDSTLEGHIETEPLAPDG